MTDTPHERLIAELLWDRDNLTPRELAARNEILSLRERLARYETTQTLVVGVGSGTVTITATDNLKGDGKTTS